MLSLCCSGQKGPGGEGPRGSRTEGNKTRANRTEADETHANRTETNETHANRTEREGEFHHACLPAAGAACPVNRTSVCKNSAGSDVCLPDNATCPADPTLLDAVNCTCVPPPCLLGNATACPAARPTLCQNSAGGSVCVADVACPNDLALLDAAVKSCGGKKGDDKPAGGKPEGRGGKGGKGL